MTKPAIPDIPPMPAPQRNVLQALKENLETLEGRRGTPIGALSTVERPMQGVRIGPVNSGCVAGDGCASAATLNEVVAKLNELLKLLQG